MATMKKNANNGSRKQGSGMAQKSIKNTYNAPVKKWRKWNRQGKLIFNYMFKTLKENQELFLHPEDTKVSARLWRTTCWNVAWIAADAITEDNE